ncbi:MAG: FtsX-like permease family protein [Acidimicrobiales bacterium]
MAKLVWRGILANLGRLALTLVSVVLGVAFVSGSFVLADSLRSIFNQIGEDAFAGVDAQVRAVEPEIQSSDTQLLRFDGSIVDDIQSLPEVAYAEGGIFGFEQTYSLDADGEPIRPAGPPVFTGSWGGPSPVSSYTLIDGEAPTGQQVALDAAQVEAGGLAVGDEVTMAIPVGQPEVFELSAIIDFGDGGTAGAYFNLFDLQTAQRVLGIGGVVDSVIVSAADGTDEADLLAAIGNELPAELEVVSGETVIGEQQDAFGEIVSIFGNVLLGFAIVVLFVSTFIIYNTFAILVGQRTQQLGLLRSVGASAGQIRFMVLFESLIIGIIASIIGLFGGLGVAWLLKQLFSTGGNSFPDGPLELRPRTIIVVLVVGLFVTVASALIPAFRASRVAPLEAVRDGGKKERSMRFRLIAGAVVLLPGLAALALGMFGDVDDTTGRLSLIGLGAALTFIGVSMLSALFAGQAVSGIGRPRFIPLASFYGGVILIVLGIALVLSTVSLIVQGFTADNFVPQGLLWFVAALVSGALGVVFILAGGPTIADGVRPAGRLADRIGSRGGAALLVIAGGVVVVLSVFFVGAGFALFGQGLVADGAAASIGFFIAGVVVAVLGYLIAMIGVALAVAGLRSGQERAGSTDRYLAGNAQPSLIRIARDNASRNPQRTAATSTALMIGLALITGVAVLTASLLATFDELLEDALTADLFIFEEAQNLPFSSVLLEPLEALPETETVAAFANIEARVDDDIVAVAAFDTDTGDAVVNVGVTDGTAEISTSGIGVYTDVAVQKELEVGSIVPVEFEDGFTTELTIEAIYDDKSVAANDWIINRELSREHVEVDEISFIGVTFPEGADVEASRAAVEDVTAALPQLAVQDNTEFQEQVESQVNQLQIVINGLLVLCLVVAFFGIVNTMALSVLERTREIGLLRAVGMTRDQLRSTIRSEALVVSVFGALLGVGMGLLLGWAAVIAIPDSFISKVGIPWVQLAIYVIVGAVIGLVAAYFPARRASQLNVLDAISHE